jgi:hypothetical protein
VPVVLERKQIDKPSQFAVKAESSDLYKLLDHKYSAEI